MIFFETIAVAFSMYSALPMPQFPWTGRNMRYAMAAFPLVGVLCGAAVWLWAWLSALLDFGPLLTGAGLALAPVLVTGGIHLDGFCDTTDALASHAGRERKLEILKDSHCGAFAVIGTACYLLFLTALCAELTPDRNALWRLSLTFLFSRAASGLAVTSFPCAKHSGLAHTFADMAARRQTRLVLLAALLAVGAALAALGGGWMLAAAAAMFGIYYLTSKRIFGGITGDLAGWFLQWCELLMVLALVITQKLEGAA